MNAICAVLLSSVTALRLNVAALVVVTSHFFTPGGRVASTAGCDSLHNAEATWLLWPWKN